MAYQSPIAQGLREYPITLLLIAICVMVFIAQLLTGVDAYNPTSQMLLDWGANFLPYSLANAPWRMVTSLFLHIGLLHLMFNMFALYYFGQVAERMVGSWNLLAMFLLAGIGGNLLNNYLGWQMILHGEMPVISAGASGGIMGIGMMLLVTALMKTPLNNIQLNYRSLLLVMAINLGYGFVVGGIDNAAHVGGAIVGALLGAVYIWQTRSDTSQASFTDIEQAVNVPTAVYPIRGKLVLGCYLGLVLIGTLIYWYLHQSFISLMPVGHLF